MKIRIEFDRRPGDRVKRSVSSREEAIIELTKLCNACLIGRAVDEKSGKVIARVHRNEIGNYGVYDVVLFGGSVRSAR